MHQISPGMEKQTTKLMPEGHMSPRLNELPPALSEFALTPKGAQEMKTVSTAIHTTKR